MEKKGGSIRFQICISRFLVTFMMMQGFLASYAWGKHDGYWDLEGAYQKANDVLRFDILSAVPGEQQCSYLVRGKVTAVFKGGRKIHDSLEICLSRNLEENIDIRVGSEGLVFLKQEAGRIVPAATGAWVVYLVRSDAEEVLIPSGRISDVRISGASLREIPARKAVVFQDFVKRYGKGH